MLHMSILGVGVLALALVLILQSTTKPSSRLKDIFYPFIVPYIFLIVFILAVIVISICFLYWYYFKVFSFLFSGIIFCIIISVILSTWQLREKSWFDRRFLRNQHRKFILFVISLLSLAVFSFYIFARVKWPESMDFWTQYVPEPIIVLILSLPVAAIFWIWRNDDRLAEHDLNRRKVENDELIVHSQNMLALMRTVLNEQEPDAIRSIAVTGLSGYARGSRGNELRDQCLAFFSSYNSEFPRANSKILNDDRVSDEIQKIVWHILNDPQKVKVCFNSFNFSQNVFKNGKISLCRFSNCSFGQKEFNNISFENVIFDNCNFDHSAFESCKFHSCDFEKCTFNHSTIKSSRFTSCELTKKDMITADSIDATSFFFCTLFDKSFCSYFPRVYFSNRMIFKEKVKSSVSES